MLYVPFPLAQHRFAASAARGAECAAQHQRLDAWLDVVYRKQDSLGLKSWGAFAAEAGLTDTAVIARCASSPARVARIDAGRAWGQALDVTGTPTVIVNGWRLPGTPTDAELHRIVDELLAGRPPFPLPNS